MAQTRPVKFRREVIDPDPNGSHQDVCLIADINGNGRGDGKPDIVGKPFQPESHVDVWFNET